MERRFDPRATESLTFSVAYHRAMPKEYGLIATEAAVSAHIEALDLDLDASAAVSSVYRAANAVRNYITNTVLRPNDLSWTGWVVMWVVWIFDGLESRHAAESAAISKGTLTGVVKTLEEHGWMRRRPDTADRRLLHLELTPAGIRMMEKLAPEFNAAEARIVASLGGRTVSTMRSGLRGMVAAVEALEVEEPGV
jgi:DNA-binding MarR family transcriptional regulator